MSGREENYQQAMQEGNLAAWEKQWERAIAFYRQALDEFPDRIEALMNLGFALMETGQYEESLQCYLKATEISSDDPIPLEKTAELYEKLGNLRQAATNSFQAGKLYLNRQEAKKAIENFKRTTRCNPKHLGAHSNLAVIFERLGQKNQAVLEYLAIASLMQQEGNLDKAIRAVEHALRILPESQEAQQALQLLKEFKPLPLPSYGQRIINQLPQPISEVLPEKVEPSFPQMNPIEESRQKALEALADWLLEQESESSDPSKTSGKGFQAILRGVASNLMKQPEPERISILVIRSIDFHSRGEIKMAARVLEQAVSQGFAHPAAYFLLGLFLTEEHQPTDALKYLQQVSEHVDYSLAANLLIGQSLVKSEKVNEATNAFLMALKLADSTTVSVNQAESLQRMYDDLISAKTYLQDPQIQKRLCENIPTLLIRSDWHKQLTQMRKDLLMEHNASTLKPLVELLTESSNSRIFESIATIQKLSSNGKLRSAIEEAFYALQFAPSFLPIHLLIGELLIQQGHLTEAVEKLITVARVYHARGEYQRAIELFDRTKNIAPMDRNARQLLINVLAISGNENRAINEYLELAEINYNLADLEQARTCYLEALRLSSKVHADPSLRLPILYRIADIDLQNLEWKQALGVFEEIRNLQPENAQVRGKIIELNFRLSRYDQAMTELENYLSYLTEQGKAEDGLEFLQKLVQEMPDQLMLQRRLASLYVQSHRIKEAVEELDQIGRKLLQSGDRNGAIEIVEAIIALNPPNKVEYQKFLMRLRDLLR